MKSEKIEKWNFCHPLEKDSILQLEESINFNLDEFSTSKSSIIFRDGYIVNITIAYSDVSKYIDLIKNLHNLEELNLIQTGLSDSFDLTPFKNLSKVNLSGNKLTGLLCSVIHENLQELNLSRNRIADFSQIPYFPNLRTLRLNGNNFSTIQGMSRYTKLEFLSLNSNLFYSIPDLSTNTKLKSLELASNKKIEKMENLGSLVQLEILDLSDNLISNIENLENMTRLKELNLEGNPLDSLYENYSEKPALYWVNFCKMKKNSSNLTFPLISFIGYSNSGKTASIESLISFLAQNGIKSIAMKHIHRENFTIDTPGKNTWKYSQAGAEFVCVHSENESSMIFNNFIDPLRLLKYLEYIINEEIKSADENRFVVILEGFRDMGERQILCASSLEDVRNQVSSSTIAIAGVISNSIYQNQVMLEYPSTPIINILNQPEKICELFGFDL